MKRNFLLGFLILVLMWVPGFPQDDDDCLSCHEDQDLTGINLRNKEVSMFVAADAVSGSIHDGMSCIDCHTDLDGVDDYPHLEELAPVDCASCHEDAAEVYVKHGRLAVGTDPDIPSCADCHGKHNILPSTDRASLVSPENVPATCGTCHEDPELTTKHDILRGGAIAIFMSSVHGRAISGGVLLAASCNDCHSKSGSAHEIYGPSDPQSTINHFNIPKTCGKCHSTVEQEFWAGIHGKLVARGETDVPVCTQCHGEHGILPSSDPRSPVSSTRVAEATCSPCHELASLNEKYGLPTGRLKTWYDSYHGLKSKAGDATVANCASCHGAHLVLPKADPKSSVHSDNLQKTCGDCHPGISPAMAAIPIHEAPGISQTPVANVVKNIYVIAIFVIIGLMVIHWIIDLRKQIKLVRSLPSIRRMTLNEVWQHTFLMTTFIVLVITGFSLRYAETAWVNLLFGWEGGFPLRGIIHRVAAVLFILTTIWHMLYLITARGRTFVRDMWPSINDFKEFFWMIAYNLNFRSEKPKFGRFSYVEKAEYWALVWGTLVMIITGFFLWYDNLAVEWFPKGFLDVTLVVHYYEAWLATLAIIVWHLYSVIFSPGVYPMNPSWIDGKMPLDVYVHEHGGDPALDKDTGDIPKKSEDSGDDTEDKDTSDIPKESEDSGNGTENEDTGN